MFKANKQEADWATDVAQYDIPGIEKLAKARLLLLQAIDEGTKWRRAVEVAAHHIKAVTDCEIEDYLELDDFTI